MNSPSPLEQHAIAHWGAPDATAWRLDPSQRSSGDPAPAVSIYRYGPTATRPWWTLASQGMSNAALPGGPGRRAELLAYVHEPEAWLGELMLQLAALPWRHQVALDWGHTISNGGPVAPLPCELTAVLMAPPHFEEESFTTLRVEDEPVRYLFLVPLTGAEAHHQAEHGLEALEEVFHEKSLDYVIRPGRKSLV